MISHPNRSKRNPKAGRNPRPEEIRAARLEAGLTQTQAGELIFCTLGGWEKWEAGDRPMHPAYWALFLIYLKDAEQLERVGALERLRKP